MRTILLLAATVVTGAVVVPGARAQVTPGTVVRLSHDDPCCESPLIGTIVGMTIDSIRIVRGTDARSAAPISLARRSVNRTERGDLVGAHRSVGALLGLVGGSVAGWAYGTATMCHQCDGMGGFSQVGGLIAGGLVGILAGTVVGSHFPYYEWRDVSTSSVGFGVAPARGGASVRIALRH